jgi:membrane-bound metal-dependent hydrolase YbcI (DUF457 family)
MQGKTHLVTGAACGLGMAIATGQETLAICATAGALGGLVPDWVQINMPGASKSIKGVFGHRGISHWLWTALAAGWYLHTAFGAELWPVAAFAVGWISHIFLDALSNGVPALWPWRLRLAEVKTGSRTDTLVGAAALIVAVLLAASTIL